MSRDLEFELTEDHVRLLRAAYVGWEDCEFGAPAIDCKRPYGNSDVVGDMAEILGVSFDADAGVVPEEADRLTRLHRETQTALQVILATGSMEPGTFERPDPYGKEWRRVG